MITVSPVALRLLRPDLPASEEAGFTCPPIFTMPENTAGLGLPPHGPEGSTAFPPLLHLSAYAKHADKGDWTL